MKQQNLKLLNYLVVVLNKLIAYKLYILYVYIIMSKTLVIIVSEICDYKPAFDSFKKNLIDRLEADLCLCIVADPNYDYSNNSFYNLAKYKFLYNYSGDFRNEFENVYNVVSKDRPIYERFDNKNALYGKIDRDQSFKYNDNITFYGHYEDINNFEEFNDDEIIIHENNLNDDYWRNKVYGIKKTNNSSLISQTNVTTYKKHLHWSEFLKINGSFLAGIKNSENEQYGCGSKEIFLKWFLLQKLIENELLNKYDRFIITRSDFVYQLPHPKMEYMNDNYIWFPNSEHYGGYTDKHVVLSKKHVENYLNILINLITRSNEYFLKMKQTNYWNLQKIIHLQLQQNNMLQFVKEFPYIMYSIKECIVGPVVDFDIIHPSEYEKSNYYKNEFEKSGLTVDNFYKNHII